MSNTDGDAGSRLDSALADVFAGTPRLPDAASRPAPAPTTDDDWGIDDAPAVEAVSGEPTEAYVLPEIVPATPATPPDEPPAPAPAARPPASAPASPAPVAAERTAPATSWSDHMSTVQPGAPAAQLRTPGRRPRVRRVTRVVRHVDPWSTFKIALLFSFVAYLVALTSGVLLWRVADATGTLANIERWFTQFGWETFELQGSEIFSNAWIIGLFGAVALTGAIVLLATLFNLVSDIVGGIRVSVLEEEVVERTVSSTRRYIVRRTPTTGADGVADWDVDGDDAPPPRSVPSRPVASGGAAGDWSIDDPDDADDATARPAP